MKIVQSLFDANFIFEVRYIQWLSNIVLDKRASWNWRIYVNHTNLNWACPKNSYQFPNVDKLVDSSVSYKLFSFMYAYSGYNQIHVYELHKENITFITKRTNYQ